MAFRSKLRTAAKVALWTMQACTYDFERKFWAQRFPRKPIVINMLANDICNSRCTMCMIWKRKRDNEITTENLRHVLADPLFTHVRGVGVTGGEPTLRADLPEIYAALVNTLPRLRGANIITNAINEKQVIDRIDRSIDIVRRAGRDFRVMVSLDGVGDVHDRNRGRDGNFDSALRVIRYYRDHPETAVVIGCTITKLNVYDVDNVLELAQAEGVNAYFRVAEFITRLYNDDETEVIRNFDDEETYHLGLFFTRLLHEYEFDPTTRRTYRSVQKMLTDGSSRRIGCPYQSRGVVLDSRGQLMYCAPKSKVIGNTIEESAWELYRRNLRERRNVLHEYCGNCIHDYHSPITVGELADIYRPVFWRGVMNVTTGRVAARLLR